MNKIETEMHVLSVRFTRQLQDITGGRGSAYQLDGLRSIHDAARLFTTGLDSAAHIDVMAAGAMDYLSRDKVQQIDMIETFPFECDNAAHFVQLFDTAARYVLLYQSEEHRAKARRLKQYVKEMRAAARI